MTTMRGCPLVRTSSFACDTPRQRHTAPHDERMRMVRPIEGALRESPSAKCRRRPRADGARAFYSLLREPSYRALMPCVI